jgi:hypothetical protein
MDILASCLGLESKLLDIVSIKTSLVVLVILEWASCYFYVNCWEPNQDFE